MKRVRAPARTDPTQPISACNFARRTAPNRIVAPNVRFSASKRPFGATMFPGARPCGLAARRLMQVATREPLSIRKHVFGPKNVFSDRQWPAARFSAPSCAGHSPTFLKRCIDYQQSRLNGIQKKGAGVGQLVIARPIEQLEPQLLLQRLDMVAQCRLRNEQYFGCSAKAPVMGKRHELPQKLYLHRTSFLPRYVTSRTRRPPGKGAREARREQALCKAFRKSVDTPNSAASARGPRRPGL